MAIKYCNNKPPCVSRAIECVPIEHRGEVIVTDKNKCRMHQPASTQQQGGQAAGQSAEQQG